jgi:alpha-beta hydrolase superfamily lysophospholipase
MPRRIVFTTKDGVEIVGSYIEATGNKVAILLHMMPADRTSWSAFASELNKRGYATLAIDERGHGDSTMGGTLMYARFTDEEQQAKILDVDAVIEFLVGEGYGKGNIIVVGASIGANLAIQTLARHHEIPLAIALSPGVDYHGVLALTFLRELHDKQKVVLVSSEDDRYSFESVKKLNEQDPVHTILITRSNIGHGTNMTDTDPSLVVELLSLLP